MQTTLEQTLFDLKSVETNVQIKDIMQNYISATKDIIVSPEAFDKATEDLREHISDQQDIKDMFKEFGKGDEEEIDKELNQLIQDNDKEAFIGELDKTKTEKIDLPSVDVSKIKDDNENKEKEPEKKDEIDEFLEKLKA